MRLQQFRPGVLKPGLQPREEEIVLRGGIGPIEEVEAADSFREVGEAVDFGEVGRSDSEAGERVRGIVG